VLDRRQLPAPPGRESEGDTTVIWQDAGGKIWRYVPLRSQLASLLATVRRQLAPAAGALRLAGASVVASGLGLTAAAAWACIYHPRHPLIALQAPSTAGLLALLAIAVWGLVVAGLGLREALAAGKLPEQYLGESRETFKRPALLAWLFDDALGRLLLEKRRRALPLYASLWGDPKTLDAWLGFTAFQSGKLIKRNLHVEALGPLEIVPGIPSGKYSGVSPVAPLRFMPVMAFLTLLTAVPTIMLVAIGGVGWVAFVLVGPASIQLSILSLMHSSKLALRAYSALQAMLEILTAEGESGGPGVTGLEPTSTDGP
jgi:hypothetical protein